MTNYMIRVELPKGRVKELLDKIDEAQETIYRCYNELKMLGVVTVVENAASGD